MKKFVIQSVALVLIIFAALAFNTGKLPRPDIGQPTQSKILINNQEIKVEIADSSEERKQGLGGRESLATDSGMLFVFPESGVYSFWMKGLKFPLDFIWIKDNTVLDILRDVKPPDPGQSDESLPIYQPNQPINKVLEINAGSADKLNIKVSDTISIE